MSRLLQVGFAGLPTATLRGGRLPIRATALLFAVVIAYNYSLQTLLRGMSLQTPLGYLALVPVVAALLAWVRLVREPAPLQIHDRQIDYIVGVALLAVAAGIAIAGPGARLFWLYRYDLLGLPFFVAGLIALLFGLRRLWALKVPVLFLFLAWPVPYAPLIGDWMQSFADLTASAVAAISHLIPIARVQPGDDTIFYVGQEPHAFAVSIGSACSGVNSLVGFIIVGGALAYAVRGPIARRVLWLFAGLVVIWLLNVVRIEAIFLVGAAFGQNAALDVLHPFAGLLVFNIGVLGMLASAAPIGLRFADLTPRPDGLLRGGASVARVRGSVILAGGLAIMLGYVNAGYGRFEAISDSLGQARLQPFDIRTAEVPGWNVQFVAAFDEATQYFGPAATWQRIQYSSGPTASLASSVPIYVDVIDTNDSGTFAAYGIEACYRFHGYRIEAITSDDLGSGITAQVVDYYNQKIGADWTALWWEWPYDARGRTAYERVIVFVSNGPKATYAGYDPNAPTSDVDRFEATDRFLFSLAHAMVQSHVAQTASR
jgi:exosortase